MKIKAAKIIQPSWILALALAIVLLFEAYMAYTDIYKNLSTDLQYTGPQNVVKLDLDAYNNTISNLDANSKYVPTPPKMTNQNPMQ